MSEFYVELQDSDGTFYGATDRWTNEALYFDELDDARVYAKDQLDDTYVVTRVIDAKTHRVVDFFQR